MKKLGLVLFCAAYTVLVSVAASAIKPDESDSQYLDAEHAYLSGDPAGSLQKLSAYLSLDPASVHEKMVAKAHNLRGLIFFQQKNLSGALQEFETSLKIASQNVAATDSTLHLVRYNYANALYQSSKTQEAYDTLQAVDAGALDIDTRVRFYHLRGNISLAKELNLQAVIDYLHASAIAKDSTSTDIYLQKAFNASRKVFNSDAKSDVSSLVSLADELPKNSPAALANQLILARGYLYLGDSAKSEATVHEFLDKAQDNHPLRAKATELSNEIQRLGSVSGDTIGLLLPLSGKFSRFGRLCMNAAFMALHIYEEMPDSNGSHQLKFAIRDSGETPESAEAALEKLILEDHAVAVVGPLLSKQFPLVAQKAQELGTPLLSLSQRVDADKLGSYIFPVALTPNQQIEMIVDYSMKKLGYKRFAIVAPSDNFGEQYVRLFWDAVESRGGAIMGIERYEPKSTDFQDEIKRLLGLEYMEARSIELTELKRRQDIYAKTLKVHGRLRERLLKNFAPKAIVDFDAVFIPDDPQAVGQIAPNFAVQDVNDIPLLGINTWNTNEIIQRAGHYLQKSLFVDAYFSSTQDKASVEFQNNFVKYFQAQPGTIEVQAYDAVTILKQVLETGSVNSRSQLREQLISKGRFAGISGDFQFSDTGVKRSAHLLTVQGTAITEVTDPVNSPE